ncbi:uncharacterized protein LOC133175505 [Saccostrea echinata]|uniref:uncharacterized protein LOC133175505 n=1 Tax=Saccostrea echinata TaxID=191078 RepID=UPI002A83933E|nr:uncharacterized protein LOC133175505 [Saccostrea echinata]
MKLKSKKTSKKKCLLCEGDVCFHEQGETMTEKQQTIPNIAEQTIGMLEKLLKERENNPEEILKLASRNDLFQVGMDPFCLTAAIGHTEGMRRFLEAGRNPNDSCMADGSTPLMLAAQNRHVEAIELLLSYGSDVSSLNSEGNNSLMVAIKTGDAKVVNTMWPQRAQVDINHRNKTGHSMLHFAVEKRWETCVKVILSCGADVNVQNNNGCTPLMLAAMKADTKVADVLIDEGADILIEDDCHCTAVCYGFEDENNGEEFVKHILCKMSQKNREVYVKNRIDRMKSMVEDADFDDFFTDTLIPVFLHLSKVEPGRDILYRDKLIPNMLSAVQKFLRHHEVVSSACAVFCSCMYRYNSMIDERFARQFLQARGPEFCLRALKFYTDSGKHSTEFMLSVFYPIVCINECKICQTWIEQNTSKIEPYISLRGKFATLKHHDEVLKEKGHTLWTRFWDEFDHLQRNQRNSKMKELLDEEERERTRKVKKRERKKQKRLREKQKRTEDSEEGIATEQLQEKEPDDSNEPGIKDEKIYTVHTDKDSGDHIGIQEQFKKEFNLVNELTGAREIEKRSETNKTENVNDSQNKEFHAAMNKSANSKENKRKKTKKSKQRDDENWSYGEDLQTNQMFSDDTQQEDSEKYFAEQYESWTKVIGKKNQQKTDTQNGPKKPGKKIERSKPSPQYTSTLRIQNSESRRWSDVLCQRHHQETAYTENNIPNPRVVESVSPIQTDDWKEFPSLKQSMTRKWEDEEDFPESMKSESTAEHWDSDEYLAAIANDPSEEVPAWVEYSKQNSTEVESDVYWMDTSEFEKNVRHTVEEGFYKLKQIDVPSTTVSSYDDRSLKTGDKRIETEFSTQNSEVCKSHQKAQHPVSFEDNKNIPSFDKSQDLQEVKDQLQASNYKGHSKSRRKGNVDMGTLYDPSENAAGLVFLADANSDIMLSENATITPIGKQNTCPWGKIPAPTLKDVAVEFMNTTVSEPELNAYQNFDQQGEQSRNKNTGNHTYKQDVFAFKTSSKPNPNMNIQVQSDDQSLFSSNSFENNTKKRVVCNTELPSCHSNDVQPYRNRIKTDIENLDTKNINFAPFTSDVGLINHSSEVNPSKSAETTEKYSSYGTQNNCSVDKNCRKMTLVELEAELLKNTYDDGQQEPVETNNTKVAVIKPIGHERKLQHEQSTKPGQAAEISNWQVPNGDREGALRSFLDGLEATGITFSPDPRLALQDRNKDQEVETISGNCPLGDSILRNALTIKHQRDDIGFPEELRDEKDDIHVNSFPGFHDPEENPADESRLALNRHKMELIQFIQLHNYYRQFSNNPAAVQTNYFHDFQYYASALGLSKQEVENIMRQEVLMPTAENTPQNNLNSRENHGTPCSPNIFTTNLQPISMTNDSHGYNTVQQSGHLQSRDTRNTDRDEAYRSSEFSMVNNGEEPKPKAVFPQSTKACINAWNKRSCRWRSKLKEIYELPEHLRRRVGDIILPAQYEKYKISYSDEGSVLGFLCDGSEVAVQLVDLKNRPLDKGFLQTLVSDNINQFFLVKYKSFVIVDDVCYLAMELHEYTLAEYTSMLRLNQGVDPLTVTRLTWQLLKGLTSLHENCGIPHGNIMPSNVLVDTEGRLRLSEYGFPRNTSRQIQLMNSKAISEDRSCWTPTEVMTESEAYSIKSDIQVAGMMICYIMSGGMHAYGENSLEITVSIQANWPKISHQNKELASLVSDMLVMPPTERPEFPDILKHPYFWADEKKLRFVLIAGSDVLRDMKHGVPTSGAVSGAVTMIDILNSAEQDETMNEWTSHVEPILMQEMRSFRQYKCTLVELVLFIYNCCLHFEKLTEAAREILEEPTKYFLSKFPSLFMSVFKAIKASSRREKVCYKPFF